MANKISLNIAGLNLIINTTEDEERVRRLNAVLNQDMTQVLQANPSASVTNAALLCALDYLSQFDKATKSASNLRNQIKDYLSDAARSKLEADETSRRNEELEEEIRTLRDRVTRMAANEATGTTNEENLKKQLEMSASECNAVRRQLHDLMEQNTSLQGTIKSQSDAIHSQNAELTRYADVITRQKSQMDQQTQLINDITRSTEAIQKDRDRLVAEQSDRDTFLADFRSRLSGVEKERDDLAEQFKAVSGEKADMESMLNDAYNEIDALKAALAAGEADSDSLRMVIDSLREELEQVKNAGSDAPLDTYFPEEAESVPSEEPAFVYEAPEQELPSFPFSVEELSEPETDPGEELARRLAELPLFSGNGIAEEQTEPEEKSSSFFTSDEPSRVLFDVQGGKIEDESTETGVGDDFLTFGQMIAHENHKNRQPAPSDTANAGEEDDLLPDLSWINDID